MTYSEISYDLRDGVATVTLEREDRLNAFTTTMQRELVAALDRTDADDAVRVVIVTGRGRAFCAGADLAAGADTWVVGDGDGEDGSGWRDEGGLVSLRLFRSLKPVIGAINGAAVGVGVTMTLPMDFRLAAESARFGFVFTRRGIVPEAASSWFLPRVVGIGQALDWVISGRIFSAEEALRAGLVRSLHPSDDLLPAAQELAAEIAQNTSSVSVAVTRQLMWRMLGTPHPVEAHRLDTAAMTALGASADAAEGVRAFLDKRAPDFPNRVSKDLPAFFPWWPDESETG